MKAVIMAGGEGTRLRPLTCDLPKPMVPILGKPVIRHSVDLLKKHKITDIAVTLMFMPDVIEDCLGNGAELGVHITGFIEKEPLGTAGSVKNAEGFLDECFIILSGDALTDLDITDAIRFHQEKKSKVTLVLKQEKQPLRYGVVLTDDSGRIRRFIEKPNWSEVTADTINTGIYIIEPEILEKIPKGRACDFGKELFPQLLKEEVPMYGYLMDSYWCDIGDISAYIQAQKDAVSGKILLQTDAVEREPGIFTEDNVVIDRNAVLEAPVYIGSGTRIKKYTKVSAGGIIGKNCTVCSGEILGGILWDGVFMHEFASVRNSILCSRVSLGEQTHVQDGCVIGQNCKLEEYTAVSSGINVWPNNIIEARSKITEDVFYAPSTPYNFCRKNFTGILGEDIQPRMLLNLGQALGTLYGKTYLTCDGTKAASAAVHAVEAGILLAGGEACHCENMILPVLRYIVKDQKGDCAVYIKDGSCLQLLLLNENGADMTRQQVKTLDDTISRGLYRTAQSDTVGKLVYTAKHLPDYVGYLLEKIPVRGEGKTIVLSGDLYNIKYMDEVLNRIGWKVILHDKSVADIRQSILVNTACFGAVLNSQSETEEFYNEKGERLYREELLYLYALLSVYTGVKQFTVPSNTSTETLEAIKALGLVCRLARSDNSAMMQEIFNGDDEKKQDCFHILFDSAYFFTYLCRYLNQKKKQLSQIIPVNISKTVLYQVPCRNTDKGRIMMHFAKEADNTDNIPEGIQIKRKNGSVVILPDNSKAACNVFAHSYNEEYARELAMDYQTLIDEVVKSGQS